MSGVRRMEAPYAPTGYLGAHSRTGGFHAQAVPLIVLLRLRNSDRPRKIKLTMKANNTTLNDNFMILAHFN